MAELGIDASPGSILTHYHGLVDALVVDSSDIEAASHLSAPVFHTSTLMQSLEDKRRVAQVALESVREVRRIHARAVMKPR